MGVNLVHRCAAVAGDLAADVVGDPCLGEEAVGRVAEAVEGFVGEGSAFGVLFALTFHPGDAGRLQNGAELRGKALAATCGPSVQARCQLRVWTRVEGLQMTRQRLHDGDVDQRLGLSLA